MKYLVLDPGTSTGYCIFEVKGNVCEISKYGYYDIENKSEYHGDWYLNLNKWLKELLDKIEVDEVIREDYFFSKKHATGGSINVAYRTVIDMRVRKLNMKYHIINPRGWKQYICGTSKPTTEQKKIYGKKANKLMVQEALETKYNIRFPQYSISQKSGRQINFRMDAIDAVAMAICFSEKYLNCKIIKPLFEMPDKTENTFYTEKMLNKFKCVYIFKIGDKKGTVCDKESYNTLCSTHSRRKQPVEKKDLTSLKSLVD